MKKKIVRWLTPPVFEGDAEKTFRAGLLNISINLFILFTFLVLLGVLIGGKTPVKAMFINILAFATGLFLHHALHRGKIKLVGLGLMIFGFIFVTGAIASLGTIRAPTTGIYLFFIILAGVLFDRYGVIVFVFISSLAVMGLILAENAGMLPQPDYSVTITQWVTYTVLFGLTGYLSFVTLQTTRKVLARAEQEIKDREDTEMELRKLTWAVEQSPVSIMITDLNGKIEYVNPRFTQVTGYTQEEVIGKNPRLLKTVLTTPETYRQLWENLTAGKEWRGEFINRKKDGTLYYEAASISPITDANGIPTHYLAVKEDITKRKQMEEALLKAEEDYRHIFEKAPIGIYQSTVDGKLIKVNQAMADIFGYETPKAAIKGIQNTGAQLYVDPADRENFRHNINKFGQVEGWENKIRRRDGSIIWTSRHARTARNEEGEILYYEGFTQDITTRKRSEDELRASEIRFRSLFEQTHDAVFILDLEGHHLAANQRAADMLGYTTEEMSALSVNETSAEREESLNVINRLITGEQISSYERLFRKKNGVIFPVEINVELVRDHAGNPLHIQSVIRDISERKQAEETLRSANEKLNLRVIEVEQLQSELREQTLRDPLTGLYNRRYLNETIIREVVRAERENKHLSVIISDIDYFKMINDTYGHQVGDKFLVEVANLIKSNARGSDIVCRYGGEEFLLVLPKTSLESAVKRAEEIRQKCADITIQYEGKNLKATMSVGVATYPDHGREAEDIIIKADKALYKSKHSGRNRVTAWDPTIKIWETSMEANTPDQNIT